MNNIKRVSKLFRLLFQTLFVVSPILLIAGWIIAPDKLELLYGVINKSVIPHAYSNLILHTFSMSEKSVGFLVSLIPLTIYMLVLYFLNKLFGLYEKGEIFALANVRYFRNIGYTLLIGQMLNPIYEGLMGVILTWNNPPGHRLAMVSLDQTNLGVLLTAFLVILISWIMAEGCKLREDQQLTI